MYSVKNEYGGPYTVRSTVDSKNYEFQVGLNIKCETMIGVTEKQIVSQNPRNTSLKKMLQSKSYDTQLCCGRIESNDFHFPYCL